MTPSSLVGVEPVPLSPRAARALLESACSAVPVAVWRPGRGTGPFVAVVEVGRDADPVVAELPRTLGLDAAWGVAMAIARAVADVVDPGIDALGRPCPLAGDA